MVLHDLKVGGEGRRVCRKGDLRVELQEPGVGHLATQEKARSLTLLLSPPPTTFEAARMQHSPAINAGAPAIPGLEDGADLELPHGTPPPVEVAETPDSQSPKQTRAPTNVRESLKSLRGQRIVAHNGPDEPDIGTRTGRQDTHLPDLPDLHTQGSSFWS